MTTLAYTDTADLIDRILAGEVQWVTFADRPDAEVGAPVLLVSNREEPRWRLRGPFRIEQTYVFRDSFGVEHAASSLALGAVVGVARLADVVPMVHTGAESAARSVNVDGDGSLWLVEPQEYPDRLRADDETTAEFMAWCATQDPPFGRPGYETPAVVWEQWCDLTGNVCEVEQRDISDQLPYGDWTPGRWACRLDDVRRLTEPVREYEVTDGPRLPDGKPLLVAPVRGRQGVWRPDPALVAACGLANGGAA